MLKRALIAVLAVAAMAVAAGCVSADHSWRGEFDARLEGAAAVVEEAREVARPQVPPDRDEYFATLYEQGKTLFFKDSLIAELNPPAGCEAVQIKGKAAVYHDSELLGDLFKELTPSLEHDFPVLLEEDVEKLEGIEREAETCA